MKLDGDEFLAQSLHQCDVCIVGSGAAGITIARKFAHTRQKVILLEAGGFEWSEQSQESYKPRSVQANPPVVDDSYPAWSRLRYFGGSTNHWGGWCRPLDVVDFEKRSWMRDSGWPISRSDIESYYTQAAEYVQIDPFPLEEETQDPGVDGISTRHYHYSPPTRFGQVYREELLQAPNVDIILNANVIRFDMRSEGTVHRVMAKNSKGEEFHVEAKIFILACGGLENPRLLLNSDHQRAGGLGNGSDMVGRCFMEHPHTSMGLFVNTDDKKWHAPFTDSKGTEPVRIFSTTAEFQEKNRTMNYSCQIGKRASVNVDTGPATDLSKFSYGRGSVTTLLNMYVRSEMAPNRNNRVMLSNERDHLGLRKMDVKINFTQEDLRSVVRSTDAVIRMLSAQALGRGRISLERDDRWSTDLGIGCHHMGTTRMSSDPRSGVVDANCKVHDLNNLYIAGSSVFATGGYANPTLTIVALSLRLSDHLLATLEGAV